MAIQEDDNDKSIIHNTKFKSYVDGMMGKR